MPHDIQIDETVSLRFACKGCGRCCESPPQMSIREALTLIDDFPLEGSLVSVPYGLTVPGRHGEVATMTRERTEQLGGYRSSGRDPTGTHRQFVTSMTAVALYPESTNRCPALQDDGLCGIYDRRPSVCRYVPAQHLVHRDKQNRALEIFYREHGGDCDWTSSAPLVLDRGRIVNPVMAAALDTAEEDDRRDGRLLRALVDADRSFSPDGETLVTVRELLSASMESPGGFNFPFALVAIFLETLREDGVLPDGYGSFAVRDIALRQAEACERMIRDNLQRKDRRDRYLTERLRELKRLNEETARIYA